MKLTRLTEEQQHILKLVVEEFYVALPAALKVHSLFATHILSKTLHHYRIRTRVIPCRLWCSLNPKYEFPGGFVNFTNTEKWNGHVVCLVGDWLVDAALYHLNPTYNYEVPKIIARRIVMPERGTYARYRMNKNVEFVWYRLPPEVSLVPLTGYEDYIDRFTDRLIGHINRLLGIVEEPVEELATDVADAESVEDTVADEAVNELDDAPPVEFSEEAWQATAMEDLQDTEASTEVTEDTAQEIVADEVVSELDDAPPEEFSEEAWQATSVEGLHDTELSSEATEEVAEATAVEAQESDAGEAAIRSEDIEASASEQVLEEDALPA